MADNIFNARVSLDMGLTNLKGAIAALNQPKTFLADIKYALYVIEVAEIFISMAKKDILKERQP